MSLIEILKRSGEESATNGDNISYIISAASFLIAGALLYWNWRKGQESNQLTSLNGSEPANSYLESELPYKTQPELENYA